MIVEIAQITLEMIEGLKMALLFFLVGFLYLFGVYWYTCIKGGSNFRPKDIIWWEWILGLFWPALLLLEFLLTAVLTIVASVYILLVKPMLRPLLKLMRKS